jgi:hypothetical protein
VVKEEVVWEEVEEVKVVVVGRDWEAAVGVVDS